MIEVGQVGRDTTQQDLVASVQIVTENFDLDTVAPVLEGTAADIAAGTVVEGRPMRSPDQPDLVMHAVDFPGRRVVPQELKLVRNWKRHEDTVGLLKRSQSLLGQSESTLQETAKFVSENGETSCLIIIVGTAPHPIQGFCMPKRGPRWEVLFVLDVGFRCLN